MARTRTRSGTRDGKHLRCSRPTARLVATHAAQVRRSLRALALPAASAHAESRFQPRSRSATPALSVRRPQRRAGTWYLPFRPREASGGPGYRRSIPSHARCTSRAQPDSGHAPSGRAAVPAHRARTPSALVRRARKSRPSCSPNSGLCSVSTSVGSALRQTIAERPEPPRARGPSRAARASRFSAGRRRRRRSDPSHNGRGPPRTSDTWLRCREPGTDRSTPVTVSEHFRSSG